MAIICTNSWKTQSEFINFAIQREVSIFSKKEENSTEIARFQDISMKLY